MPGSRERQASGPQERLPARHDPLVRSPRADAVSHERLLVRHDPQPRAPVRDVAAPRVALPPQVRVFEIELDVTVAAFRGVVVIDWRGSPTVDALARVDGYLGKIVVEYARFVVLVIIEPGNTKTPSSEARQENGRLTQKYEGACAGIGTVLEGESVKHSIVRFSLATIQLLSSTRVSQPVFDSVPAASRWAAELMLEPTGREISSAIEAIRALRPKQS